jgi:hypothetical protein
VAHDPLGLPRQLALCEEWDWMKDVDLLLEKNKKRFPSKMVIFYDSYKLGFILIRSIRKE